MLLLRAGLIRIGLEILMLMSLPTHSAPLDTTCEWMLCHFISVQCFYLRICAYMYITHMFSWVHVNEQTVDEGYSLFILKYVFWNC